MIICPDLFSVSQFDCFQSLGREIQINNINICHAAVNPWESVQKGTGEVINSIKHWRAGFSLTRKALTQPLDFVAVLAS